MPMKAIQIAVSDFDAKPGDPEPHRDIMLSAAKRLQEQQRLITKLRSDLAAKAD